MPTAKRAIGDAAEDAAADWYRARGYEILARQWRVRAGEIDIVAARGRTVVICEVKARSSDAFGSAAAAVTPVKQRRLRGLALEYLAQTGRKGVQLRFDVATARPGAAGPVIDVIEGAF